MIGRAPKQFDIFALLEDLPERGLKAGAVGTVLDFYPDGCFEVEFCDEEGKSDEPFALSPEQILVLEPNISLDSGRR